MGVSNPPSGPQDPNTGSIPPALRGLDAALPELVALYRDLHAHPELSFEEHRTAAEIARHATAYGCDVTPGVGRTGVVAVLDNGAGPTVLLRADFDALPLAERTGLPYASRTEGVMHACGHDLHVTCLLGALKLLAAARGSWRGRRGGRFGHGDLLRFGTGPHRRARDGLTIAGRRPSR